MLRKIDCPKCVYYQTSNHLTMTSPCNVCDETGEMDTDLFLFMKWFVVYFLVIGAVFTTLFLSSALQTSYLRVSIIAFICIDALLASFISFFNILTRDAITSNYPIR